MYFYLSKLLPPLIMPVGVVLGLMVFALIFQFFGKQKTSSFLMLCALLLLWISSTPIVASALYGKLEQEYPPVSILDVPSSKCIILLGGSVATVRPPRVDFDMSDSIDRVRMAARLQLVGKGSLILVIAGNARWSSTGQSEAQATEVLLGEWGVQPASIVLDDTSRNTRENAVAAAGLIKKWGCGVSLLVTSAAHMPRSVAAFRKVGVDVFPVSTDVKVTKKSGLTLHDWIPNALSLKMTTNALREQLGRKVYEFRGWN